MRRFDWEHTSIGSPDRWPESLKTAIRIILTSRQPFWLGWGEELIYFYNDPYKSIIGGKHPAALGQPTSVVWREIWDDIGPLLASALGGKEGTYVEEQRLIMERNGYPEETYYTYSYSPIFSDDGAVGGIICANTDDTQRVIGERQLALLRELAARTAEARNREQACERAAQALATNPYDLPFAMIYTAGPVPGVLTLVGSTGIDSGHTAASTTLPLSGDRIWPVAAALANREPQFIADLKETLPGSPPTGAWSQPPNQAIVLPLPGSDAAVLIAGLNPFRLFDESYAGFLDLLVGQIATAITNAEAYEAERRRAEALAEIDRAKTAFFSNASHEFRTPLTLMLSPLEELLLRGREERPVPVAYEEIELIHRNGLRLLKLVNSLLDFSRIEAGRAEASYAPADLAQLTAELASNFRSACERAGLTLTVDCPPRVAPVHIDRDMWEKIVLNLISNAFKFTFDGGISVTLDEDEGTARLIVRDTGVGIPEAEIPRLFERFHRIEGQRSRTYEGSGIGLALVQELVRLHGGTIAVESAAGRGTAFTVRIPFGTAHLAPERVGARPRPAVSAVDADAFVQEALRWLPDEADAGLSAIDEAAETDAFFAARAGGRVLLADDNADMRDYVRRLLSGRCEVRTASDGRAALDAIHTQRPDLVLADVMMPEMDGFELLRRIRGDERLRDIPVILLSARAGEESRVEGLAAGANDYLVKPFAARELIARVGANLELARVRTEATAALHELNETLAQRVEAEVAERMKVEEALRQALKMEAIGQLTGGVAHDFNNLLQVVLGNLDTLRRRVSGTVAPTRSEIMRFVESAMRGADRAASLTQRLLAFSRRQPLEPRPVDINRLVTGMSELLRRTLGESIAIETVLGGGAWRIHADPNQLENSIINLAVNARDAMPNGGRLTIESANAHLDEAYATEHQEVLPGQYVMLAVSDTGMGMSKEVLASAFDPFFTTKEIGQGTGLGLSQVYGFVKQSGGHVKIYSELGEGTTVRIYLPRLVDAVDVEEEIPVSRMPSGDGSEIILLVEDDEAVRDLNAAMLRELNYAVIEAEDGRKALQILNAVPNICVLFTDVGLPGTMNGRQLAEAAIQRRSDLRVLFTTGYARNAIVHHGRLDPGINLLSKPFTAAALATKIRDLIDRR